MEMHLVTKKGVDVILSYARPLRRGGWGIMIKALFVRGGKWHLTSKHLAVCVAPLRNGFSSLFPLVHCSSERLQKGSGFEVKKEKKKKKKTKKRPLSNRASELLEPVRIPNPPDNNACTHPQHPASSGHQRESPCWDLTATALPVAGGGEGGPAAPRREATTHGDRPGLTEARSFSPEK